MLKKREKLYTVTYTVSVGVIKLISEESRASMNLNCPNVLQCDLLHLLVLAEQY